MVPGEVTLSREEQAELLTLHENAHDIRVKRRVRGLLLLAGGRPMDLAADEAGLSSRSLHTWTARYLESRLPEALVRAARPPGGHGRLRSVLEELVSQDPVTLGYSTGVWTTALVRTHLASEAGVHVPPPVIRRFLAQKELGSRALSNGRPAYRPRRRRGRREAVPAQVVCRGCHGVGRVLAVPVSAGCELCGGSGRYITAVADDAARAFGP